MRYPLRHGGMFVQNCHVELEIVTRATWKLCARSSPSALALVVTARSTTLVCGIASGECDAVAQGVGATCRDRTDDYRFHKPGLCR